MALQVEITVSYTHSAMDVNWEMEEKNSIDIESQVDQLLDGIEWRRFLPGTEVLSITSGNHTIIRCYDSEDTINFDYMEGNVKNQLVPALNSIDWTQIEYDPSNL